MTDDNKASAIAFINLIAAGKIDEAYSKYIAEEFKHHNAYFEGSAKSLQEGMKKNAIANPDKVIDIKRVIAENEFVVIHFHVRHKPADLGAAVMHILRFADGKIVEMWDLGQPISKDSPNQYGMF